MNFSRFPRPDPSYVDEPGLLRKDQRMKRSAALPGCRSRQFRRRDGGAERRTQGHPGVAGPGRRLRIPHRERVASEALYDRGPIRDRHLASEGAWRKDGRADHLAVARGVEYDSRSLADHRALRHERHAENHAAGAGSLMTRPNSPSPGSLPMETSRGWETRGATASFQIKGRNSR